MKKEKKKLGETLIVDFSIRSDFGVPASYLVRTSPNKRRTPNKEKKPTAQFMVSTAQQKEKPKKNPVKRSKKVIALPSRWKSKTE